MMSTIKTSEDNTHSGAIHSQIIEGAKFRGTPAYEFALKRLLALGLTSDEAKEILKG